MAILVREGLSILPLSVDGPWCDRLDAVAIRLSTVLGSLAVISVYAPPESGVDLITRTLERCGAYRPSSLSGKWKS